MTVTGKATATFNGKVIAETDKWEVVEGNVYFPPSSTKSEYFTPNDLTTICPWKGTARYYNIEVNGKVEPGAAWYYPECKERAKHIEGYVAFCKLHLYTVFHSRHGTD